MTTDATLRDPAARLADLQAADVAIAVPSCGTAEAVQAVAEAARRVTDSHASGLRIVVAYPDTVVHEATRGVGAEVQLMPWRLPPPSRLPLASGDRREAFLPLSTIGTRAGARACALIGALPEAITAETIGILVEPILDQQADLLLPSYPRHRLDGLINTGIVYPLVRALYGRQVDGQLGVDFGLSPRMVATLVEAPAHPTRNGPVWLLAEAADHGLQVGQAYLPIWLPPTEEAGDVSHALAQVLGSLFGDLEHHATTWQRVRGSRPVPAFGTPAAIVEDHRAIDIRAMVESFQLGYRNLQELWTRILPPATMVALGRLARVTPDEFRFPDELWARTVFDFALGHRLRVISRDHLLRAMTPVYLGWVASFVREVGETDQPAVARRIELICRAYEAQKPYLLARWRWPDRFTP